MNLDAATLFMVTTYIQAILGLLLLFAWLQDAAMSALPWWGCAQLVSAMSIALFGLRSGNPEVVSIDIVHALLFIACALTWTGARIFDGRKPLFGWLFAGSALWLGLSQTPLFERFPDARLLLASAIVVSYTWLTAYEFFRGREEPLLSRWPAVVVMVAYGCLFLLRTPLAHVSPWRRATPATDTIWLTVLSFEALLFTITIAFILLAMAKERAEFRHKRAALVDPLTGLANRRAFLTGANAVVRDGASDTSPGAVLLIDLDHFKSINDRFGHAVGDRVLELFGDLIKGLIRNTDLAGRVGGEEFAAVLCNADQDAARAVAERIRTVFAEKAEEVDGHPVRATLSIGIVLHHGVALNLTELLAQADHALYEAKARGRNRIEAVTFDLLRRRAVGRMMPTLVRGAA